MKRFGKVFFVLIIILFFGCASNKGSSGISLEEAITQSVKKLSSKIPAGSRVAVVAFDSQYEELSAYIMEEISSALFSLNIEVADRKSIEQSFRMTWDMTSRTAQSIGKFLDAQFIITGQLTYDGETYHFRTDAIHVEKAARANVTQLKVRSDEDMRQLVAVFEAQHKAAILAGAEASANAADVSMQQKFEDIEKTEVKMEEPALPEASEAVVAPAPQIIETAPAVKKEEPVIAVREAPVLPPPPVYEAPVTKTAENHMEQGLLYANLGAHEVAIEEFSGALNINPAYTLAYINRGIAYFFQKDYNKAIADYTQAIRLNPNHAQAYYNRGIAYRNNNDYDRAIVDYSQAIRLDPNYILAYYNRGIAYRNKSDYDRAIADYSQAIRLDPNYLLAYNNRGIAHFYKKDYDRAISDFETALRIDPGYSTAKQNLDAARLARLR